MPCSLCDSPQVVYGGFYEAFRDSRWFGDLHVFDLRGNKWTKIAIPGTAQTPAARSGCQFVSVNGRDTIIMYGGFSHVKQAGGRPK